MGRCRCFLSQIVEGYTHYDTRRCGGPIGAIRGSQGLSSVIFHGFCPFSLRDAAQSLPRLLPRVDGLLWPFFVSEFVARGCLRVELLAKNPKKTECGCYSGLSNLLAGPVGWRICTCEFEALEGFAQLMSTPAFLAAAVVMGLAGAFALIKHRSKKTIPRLPDAKLD